MRTTHSAGCPPARVESSLPARFPRPWPRSTRVGCRRRSWRRSSAKRRRRPERNPGGQLAELLDYAGRRVVVTGCASGIGAALVGQLTELGADVIGLDVHPPAFELNDFHRVDLSDPASIDAAVGSVSGQVDGLFNVAGVSSGIGNPLLVVKIDFLGTRHLTEALAPRMPSGSAIASVSSLAA